MKNKFVVLILLIFLLNPQASLSFPGLMQIYNNDKFAKPDKKNKCNICHANLSGGGPLNNFGEAFDVNNHKITNDLRQQFPELFNLLKSVEPKILRVLPKVVVLGKETIIKIKGKNFNNDDFIFVDGERVDLDITFVNASLIEVRMTFDEAGKHTVQIENALGQKSNLFKVKVKPAKKNV